MPLLVEALNDPELASSAARALVQISGAGDEWTAAQWKAWWSRQKH